MGGFGSGRLGGFGRDTVESCRSIDVNRLHRVGYFPAEQWDSRRSSRVCRIQTVAPVAAGT